MIRVSHPPTKPRLYATLRYPVMGVPLAGGALGAWWGAANALAGTPAAFDAPTTAHAQLAGVALAGAFASAGAVAGARHYRWTMAMESQKVYEQIARVLRLPLDERARMKVRARDGIVPSDVRVRVESVTAVRDERVRKNLARAFGDATGEPADRVRVETVKRGVRLWIEKPAEVHEPDDYTEPVYADDEPTIAPVPARPADDHTQEQITEAMRGVLASDKVEAQITDTEDDGYPREVWVTYPPRLSGSVTEQLVRMRAVLGQIAPSRADEWAVRLVGPKCRVVFTARIDPLAGLVNLPEVEDNPDLHKGVVIGVTESGAPWRLPLMGGLHTLVAGASQAGKGSVLWNIVRAVGPMIADGRVRLWIVDPKGGAEFHAAEPIAHRFAVSVDEAESLLEDLREVMVAKARVIAASGRRKIEEPTTEEPLDLCIIDELANVTGLAGKQGQTIGDHIAALCSMGRAPAVTVIGALQDPRKETFKHRNLFTAAVALRLREAGETNLVLGQGARAQGALSDLIPKKYPGIAYVISDEHLEPERVRTAFVSDAEAAATVQRATPPREAPPIGAPIARAEQDELVATTRAHPAASNQPRARAPQGAQVRIVALNNLPVRAHFDGDANPVTITGWENSDEEDRIIVSFHYDDGPSQDTDVEDDMTVRLAT